MELNNSQYNTIMRAFERRQTKNLDIQRARYAEVCQRLPEFAELDEAISSVSVSYGKRLLFEDAEVLCDLKQELHSLRERKQQLLQSAGFPEDYLAPVFQCKDCKDTGYIGKEKCHCFKKAVVQLLYDQSNLKELPSTSDFEHFRLDYYPSAYYDKKTGRSARENMQEVLRVCHQFIDEFDTQFRNLFFYGSVGVGKTFLSTCVAREIMNREFSVLYYSAPQLFNNLAQAAFNKEGNEASDLVEYIYSCDLLIIDDLGSELTNAFTSSQFFSCINERLLHKKSTIISTNLSLDTLADLYTERSFSRITSGYTLLKIFGDDIRLKKKLEL